MLRHSVINALNGFLHHEVVPLIVGESSPDRRLDVPLVPKSRTFKVGAPRGFHMAAKNFFTAFILIGITMIGIEVAGMQTQNMRCLRYVKAFGEEVIKNR